MELKTNYQYTYFILPYVIKEGRYQKYLLKLLKDKEFRLKTFQKEKDFKMYQYFLPKTKDFLFSSFSLGNSKIKKLNDLPDDTKSAILSKYPCNIFEYNLKRDIQGKIEAKLGNEGESKGENQVKFEDKSGIFFTIGKIEIICFETGICFLVIKTNIEDDYNFENVLNFNYKFKDINNEVAKLDGYDNIRLQTNSFSSAETFKDFVRKITGANLEAMKLDIDTERFLTYSYVCIDQEAWNSNTNFDDINHYYIKYANILPADNSRKLEEEKITTVSRWKYAKLALSKLGVMLFSSSEDMNNYTILPDEFENQYLYTYILNLYKKIYLKKIEQKLKDTKKVKIARRKFVDFTKKMWIQEITEDEIGTMLNHKIGEVLELENLYGQVKNKYDVLYKDLNIEKDKKLTITIGIILVASLIFNILNFIALMRQ